MAGEPLVSVLLPAYNDIEFVAEAVDSILGQTYRNLEILVLIDLGSADGTADYVKGLSDPRLSVIEHTEHRGIARSLNIGLRLAAGSYVARMDADDVSLPTRIEKQVAFMESHPEVVLCGTHCQLFGDENWQFRPACDHRHLRMELLLGCAFIHPSMMFRKKEFLDAGLGYDESLGATEDYDLWSRAAHKVQLANLPEILLNYRKHRRSATLRNQDLGRSIYRNVMKAQLEALIDPLSSADCDFHYRVFSGGLSGAHELPALRDWFERLVKANSKVGVYDAGEFQAMLADRLHGLCRGFDTPFAHSVWQSSFLSNGTEAGRWASYRARLRNWLRSLRGDRGGAAHA